MSEPADRSSAENTEEPELVGRREAVVRFAKYTAPVMLAMLVSTSGATTAFASPG
jgi:hypothetical protein